MAGQLRADGASLAYERYDLLPKVDTGAIVENKRLSHALQTALVIQVHPNLDDLASGDVEIVLQDVGPSKPSGLR
jgi:hypothetical protein